MEELDGTPDFRLNARHLLIGIRANGERIKDERRAGRKVGKLSASLREQLRACNILQLRSVKQLCDKFTADQKAPPEVYECRKRFTEEILVAIPIKHRLFQLEIRRSSIRRNQSSIYLNGPYLYAYYRDGQYIREQYFRKGKWKDVPRKVRRAVAPHLANGAAQPVLERILAEYKSGKRSL